MARGIGSMTVGVHANSSKAVQQLKVFRGELKATGNDARKMAAEFNGNTLADFQQRFAKNVGTIKKPELKLTDSVVDLRNETRLYAALGAEARSAAASLRMLSSAMRVVSVISKGLGLAGIVVTVAQLGIQLYRNKNVWIDWGTSVGRMLGVIEQEGQRADEILGRKLDKQIQQMHEQRRAQEEAKKAAALQLKMDYAAELAAAKRAEAVARLGAEEVRYWELIAKYGRTQGSIIAREEDQAKQHLVAKEKQRLAQEKAQRDRTEKLRDEMERTRADAERTRADAEAVARVRERVIDFGKSDLQRDRDSTLREIASNGKRAEAEKLFAQLERMQDVKDLRESLRTKFVSAQDPFSREGAAQRVRTLAQNNGNRVQEKQLEKLTHVEQHLERMARNPGVVLKPANLSH